MSGKNVCEGLVHTVNLSAYKCVKKPVPLSKCLLIAPCKTTMLPKRCVPQQPVPPIPCCPPTKPLRLCNPLEARKLVKPGPCVCRPIPPPMTGSQRLTYMLGFALRCGVIIGLIYFTNLQGLWSGHAEAENLYGRILSNIFCWTGWNPFGIVKENEPVEVPRLNTVTFFWTEFWNKLITGVFNVIMFIPRSIGACPPDPSSSTGGEKKC